MHAQRRLAHDDHWAKVALMISPLMARVIHRMKSKPLVNYTQSVAVGRLDTMCKGLLFAIKHHDDPHKRLTKSYHLELEITNLVSLVLTLSCWMQLSWLTFD